ncbi:MULTISPECIES: universal stress protein [unclassified Caballeronia]|uniref:universal stress protein n=1 Tax=unclassified Caballeronia TaxID=2646786 RepID=UPI00285CF225|nr:MULTISPECIES: universal stress protein [unclassified Caballeronia]MDR5739260.1 universal stress protein [Caballeronia sp. LZ016]MDR5807750.1 universal stress protein [Caballeronia sp. LZ019]
MFKRIIVAIDGSRTSQHALNTALDLAVTHHAVVQPYCVIESGPMVMDVPGYDPSALQKGLTEQGEAVAREAAEAMKARGVAGDVATVEATASDDVASLIIAAAHAFNADLLVMGTHGRKGFKRMILGSVAERCLRQASLPVLLIPSAANNSDNASTA